MTTYKDAGVDIEAGHRAVALMKAAVEATHGTDVLGGIGRFGGLFDARRVRALGDAILVASTDGVGTKTRVASALGRFDTIGEDIVNHCVNDILVQGAEPLFFLDYVASAKLDPEVVATVVSGAARACQSAGCALLGGETAEMPGVYHDRELDLVGTIVGVVSRADLIDGSRIEAGDTVLALPSSGLHTNGYSLARRALAAKDLTTPRDELEGRSLGDALLAPHRSYLSEFRALRAEGIDIRGLVHVTGGGLIDNPPRIVGEDLAFRLDRAAWSVPPLFRMIQAAADIGDFEMARPFNLGLGLLIVVPRDQAAAAASVLLEMKAVGSIVRRTGDPVELVGEAP